MTRKIQFSLLSAALAAGPALALEPANYPLGPVFLTPTLNARLGYDDNLYRTDGDKEDSIRSRAVGRLQAWAEEGASTYSLAYQISDNRYFDSSDDDYTDHQFNLDIHQVFNARNQANLWAEYFMGTEERGTGLSEGAAQAFDEPVEFDRTTLGSDYTYGTNSSRGRLTLGAKAAGTEYQNFRQLTRERDYDQYSYSGAFFWKVAPRVDVLIDGRYAEVEYDRDNSQTAGGSRDSEETSAFVGVAWEATAKTSGSLRVGGYDREYDSDERGDDNGFSWEVDVTWKPRTYSSFNLASRRYSQETNGVGDSIDTNTTALTWAHQWNGRSSTNLGVEYQNSDYTGAEREDDQYNLKASYNYNFRRWADFGVGYRYEDRDSDLDLYDYSRNVVFIEAKLSL